MPEQPADLGGIRALPRDDRLDTLDGLHSGDELPEFPLEVLPSLIREMAEGFAGAVDTSVDLVLPGMFATLSAALGPHWVAGAESYSRPPSNWFALVAPSGSAKTPANAPILQPLHAEDRRLLEKFNREHAAYKKAEQRAGRGMGPAGDELVKPARQRAAITDITPEGAVSALADSPNGVLIHSDELSLLLESLEGSGRSVSRGRSTFLSLWSGSRVAESRKVAAESCVENPYLVVFGGVQPSVLSSLQLRNADGLTGRFLWSIPRVVAGGLGRPVAAAITALWEKACRLCLTHAVREPQRYTNEGEELLSIHIRAWRSTSLELEACGQGLRASMYGKAAEYCIRLSALLHGLDALETALRVSAAAPALAPRALEVSTLQRSIELTEYYLAHGDAVTGRVTGTPVSTTVGGARDQRLAARMKELVEDEGEVAGSASLWVQKLRPASDGMTPVAMGHALRRLARAHDSGVLLERATRGVDRSWKARPATPSRVSSPSKDAPRPRDRAGPSDGRDALRRPTQAPESIESGDLDALDTLDGLAGRQCWQPEHRPPRRRWPWPATTGGCR